MLRVTGHWFGARAGGGTGPAFVSRPRLGALAQVTQQDTDRVRFGLVETAVRQK